MIKPTKDEANELLKTTMNYESTNQEYENVKVC